MADIEIRVLDPKVISVKPHVNGVPLDAKGIAIKGDPGTIDERTQAQIVADVLAEIPEWSKASEKPTYTASEVGALPATTVIPTDAHINELINTALGVVENGTY